MHPTLSAPLVFILQVILFHPTSCTTPSPELELCIRLETYMDNVEVLVEEPVKMKRYQWCVGVPPRCTTFTTELKNRTKIESSVLFLGCGKEPNSGRVLSRVR
uniref:Secreted protein n=1 Tax=Cacopsylla melanoneura TaxID=428564 RepID=A0A8D8SEX9_9HEMI